MSGCLWKRCAVGEPVRTRFVTEHGLAVRLNEYESGNLPSPEMVAHVRDVLADLIFVLPGGLGLRLLDFTFGSGNCPRVDDWCSLYVVVRNPYDRHRYGHNSEPGQSVFTTVRRTFTPPGMVLQDSAYSHHFSPLGHIDGSHYWFQWVREK